MGLVNAVVPPDKLDEEVGKWYQELLEKSPTALKMLKYSFHGETDGVMGISNLGVGGLSMFYETDESLEGKTAFMERRKPDYAKFQGQVGQKMHIWRYNDEENWCRRRRHNGVIDRRKIVS